MNQNTSILHEQRSPPDDHHNSNSNPTISPSVNDGGSCETPAIDNYNKIGLMPSGL